MGSFQSVAVETLLADNKGISVGVMYPGEDTPGGVPLIRVGDIVGNRISSNPSYRISERVHQEYRRTALRGGECLITLVGRPGVTIVVPPEMRGWNAARALAVVRLKEPEDARFFVYAMSAPAVQHTIENWCNTTVQATLNLKEIKALTVPWPDRGDRQRIVEVLGSLDDKIELNRRMDETLEAMAQAIFRDWFVDFGPTRRKLDGATDLVEIMGGLLSDGERARSLADLFPAKLGDAGLPEGWRDTTLGTVAKDFGGTIQTGPFGSQLHQSDYTVSGNPVVMPANLTYSGFREGDFSYVSSQTTERLSKHRLDVGDIVYGRRGDIGRKALIGKNNAGWLCGTGCLKLSFPSKAIPPEYLYYWLDQQNTVDWIRSRAIGATMPNLNTSTLGELPLLSPPYPTLVAFEEIVKDLLALQEQNDQQNRTLAATRDLLLPQLMSGEICLAEAEGLLEAAQ